MADNLTLPNKRSKYVLGMLLVIALISVGLSIYIKKLAFNKILALPGITCTNLDLNLLTGCIDLEKVNIEQVIGKEKMELIKIHSSKVHLHGFSYWQFLKKEVISINDLIFVDLDINIEENTKSIAKKNQTDSTSNQSTIAKILIKNITIDKGQFALQNKSFQQISLDSFALNLKQFQFFPARDSQQIHWAAVSFQGNQLLLDQKDKDNRLLVATIDLSATQNLALHHLHWQPKYSKANYLNHHQYGKARLDAIVPTLEIHQFALDTLIFQQQLQARTILAQEGKLEIYTDKNKPNCPDCRKTYHYEDFITSELGIDIDSILLKDATILLEELGKDKEEPGQLDWTKVYASVYNLTNHPQKQQTHPNTVADIQAVFVEDGNVKLHFEFPNFNTNADYHFRGSLDKIDLEGINSFLVFSKRLSIREGIVTKFAFNGRGNRQEASGEMELRYKGLALQFFKKDFTPRNILTKVANKILSNKNNPDKENKLRKGKMFSERQVYKSFISNWWQTLQSGIKSTMLPNILLPEELKQPNK